MADEHDAQDPREELNADDFIDAPPNRIECRQLLKEANGKAEKIKAWNNLRLHFDRISWQPDISSEEDPWDARGYRLSVISEDGEQIAAHLWNAKMDYSNLSGAWLERADMGATFLNNAHLNNARLRGAILSESELRQCNFRKAHLEGARLDECDLTEANFLGANLKRSRLCKSICTRANFIGADLDYALLQNTQLQNTKMTRLSLTNINMSNANFTGADLRGTNLSRTLVDNAIFNDSLMNNANFGSINQSMFAVFIELVYSKLLVRIKYRFKEYLEHYGHTQIIHFAYQCINGISGFSVVKQLNNACPTTSYDNADLRHTANFIPNGQSVRGTRFAARANDPYSIVRGKYTGPLMLFNLIFLAAFFTPYIIRAGAWTAVERVESSDIANQISSSGAMHYAPEMVERSLLWVVLGFGSGFWGILAGILSIVFVIYNIVRAIMTWWMSQVRDAEERSGHLPEIQEYWWCYTLHTYFMRWVFWIAVGSFFYHAIRWASSTVSVPPAFA